MGGKRTRPKKDVYVEDTENEPSRKKVAKKTAKPSLNSALTPLSPNVPSSVHLDKRRSRKSASSKNERDELVPTLRPGSDVEDVENVEDVEDDDADLEGFIDDYPDSDTENMDDHELDHDNNRSLIEETTSQEPSRPSIKAVLDEFLQRVLEFNSLPKHQIVALKSFLSQCEQAPSTMPALDSDLEELWSKFVKDEVELWIAEKRERYGEHEHVKPSGCLTSPLAIHWNYAPDKQPESNETATPGNICMRTFADKLGLARTKDGLTDGIMMYERFFRKVTRSNRKERAPYRRFGEAIVAKHSKFSKELTENSKARTHLEMGLENVEEYIRDNKSRTNTSTPSLFAIPPEDTAEAANGPSVSRITIFAYHIEFSLRVLNKGQATHLAMLPAILLCDDLYSFAAALGGKGNAERFYFSNKYIRSIEVKEDTTIDTRDALEELKSRTSKRKGPPSDFTSDEDEKVVSLRNRGFDWDAIGTQLGKSAEKCQGRYYRKLRAQDSDPRAARTYMKWTKEDDEKLLRLKNSGLAWKEVAKSFPLSTMGSMMARFRSVGGQPGVRQGVTKWTDEEFERLKKLVETAVKDKGGHPRWDDIAAQMPGRNNLQCKKKYNRMK